MGSGRFRWQPAKETANEARLRLVLVGPDHRRTVRDLAPGELTLGRGTFNHVVLHGVFISRRHAVLRIDEDGVICEDLQSTNGTWLNGRRIEGPTPFETGDRLRIGGYELSLEQVGANDEGGEAIFRAPIDTIGLASRLRANATPHSFLDPLALVCQVSERLAEASTLRAFLEDVAELSLELARARTVAILLLDETGELEPGAIRHQGTLAQGELPISRSIVEATIRDRTALCTADAASDQRFASRESIARYEVAQVICIPLCREEGEVLGAIYLNRQGTSKELNQLVEALSAIAHLTASGIEHQRLRDRAEREMMIRRSLERFLAPDVVDRVAGGADTLQMEERWGTVLFADISGFTRLTETARAEDIVALLDRFYRQMTQVVFEHGGTVDKFIGDAIMAIFGVPYAYGDDAARALRAAREMERRFAAMGVGVGGSPCRLKVGVHTGTMLAGTVGGEHRLEYTAIGDTVNVAARLVEGAAPGEILVSRAALEAAGAERFPARPLGERQLRGRRGTVELFALATGEER